MIRRASTMVSRGLLAGFGLLVPALALAQGNPSNPADFGRNPHPTMPWSGVTNPNRIDYGSVLRYIPVPAQPVTIEMPAPAPEGFPPQKVQQVVEIPGYQVVETTTGFYVPEHWALDQLNAGVYQWRRVLPEFKPKQ
jgi:hypothetical protein